MITDKDDSIIHTNCEIAQKFKCQQLLVKLKLPVSASLHVCLLSAQMTCCVDNGCILNYWKLKKNIRKRKYEKNMALNIN